MTNDERRDIARRAAVIYLHRVEDACEIAGDLDEACDLVRADAGDVSVTSAELTMLLPTALAELAPETRAVMMLHFGAMAVCLAD
jgi:hypothetical protein